MAEVPRALYQCWFHSREEDGPDKIVYRPVGFPFPPARGRVGIEFRPDGGVTHYAISPRDGSRGVSGRWWTDAHEVVHIEPEEASVPSYALKLLSVSDDKLVVQRDPG